MVEIVEPAVVQNKVVLKMVIAPGKFYQRLWINDDLVASLWGEAKVDQGKDGKYFVTIGDADGFVHNVDQVQYINY